MFSVTLPAADLYAQEVTRVLLNLISNGFYATTKRRQMADIGITAQRYTLVLYGNAQQLKIEPWEPEVQRSVTVPSTARSNWESP